MRPNRKAQLNAGISSRRFSKGIACRILSGPIISFIFAYSNKLLPIGLILEDPQFGVSLSKSKLLAVPIYDYKELIEVAKQAGYALDVGRNQEAEARTDFLTGINNTSPVGSITSLDSIARRHEPLIRFLEQKMLIIDFSKEQIPKNIPETLKAMDVLVDSLDIAQSITGTLIPKSRNIETEQNWNRK